MQKEGIDKMIIHFEVFGSSDLTPKFSEKVLLNYAKSIEKNIFWVEADNYSEQFYLQTIGNLIDQAQSILLIFWQIEQSAKFSLPFVLLDKIRQNHSKMYILSPQSDFMLAKIVGFLPDIRFLITENQTQQKEFVKYWLSNP